MTNTLANYNRELIMTIKALQYRFQNMVKGVTVTNTLAYYNREIFTTIKSFMIQNRVEGSDSDKHSSLLQ